MSLRKVSTIKRILGFNIRHNDTQAEDEWFGKRVTTIPGAKVANDQQAEQFSVEDIWHDKPLGYHVPDGGKRLPDEVWKDPARRKTIFEYCPELSMIMPMKLEWERCEGDNKEGKIAS